MLAHEALDLSWGYADPVAPLWSDLVSRAADADRAEVALQTLLGWAKSHEQNFFGRHRDNHDGQAMQPNSGWAGRWDAGDDWEYIAITPHHARDVLRAEDFSSADIEAVARLWRERGWIETEAARDGKTRHPRLRVAGVLQRLIKIRRDAIDDEA
ncbi:MAG: hypothetical protein M3Q49_09155 [Actinomycetota bacterium]|nr:hypothetical protein [Actinomycetota bacterium]